MFKVRIRVGEGTDIAAEVDNLLILARKHGIDEAPSFALGRDAETILAELKRQRDETAPYGIHVTMSKTLKTPDYEIIFDLRETAKPAKRGFFSRVFGK